MSKKVLFKEFVLLITTIIWGIAFVFQDIGGKYIDAYTINVSRSFIAALFLFVFALIVYYINKKQGKEIEKLDIKHLIIGGACCGLPLAIASTLQQLGINMEGAGKSGFLTAIYIIFVPIFGLIFKKKTNILAIIAIVVATLGLYFINVTDGKFEFSTGSVLLLGCAIAYSFQILFVDKFSKNLNCVHLSVSQFVFSGLFSLPMMLIFGNTDATTFFSPLPLLSILFLGIMSSGVAYTLQIFGQKDVNSTVAALIMSFESVFSLIFGMLILKETHTFVQYIGCALIFIAVVVSQIPLPNKKVNIVQE